jgi:hypothetical protein
MYTISIKMGLWMLVGYISFFSLMYVMGLAYHKELRIFYVFIQLFCIYRAIRACYAIHPKSIHNNLWGVAQGMITSAVGILGFILFLIIVLSQSPTLLSEMRLDYGIGLALNPYTASLFILAEGLVASLIGSYILTRISEVEPITKADKLD